MTKRMLIDATHSEETRVAVVDNTKLMEFDYESQVRKQIKGTIFLAKVTRVEPSLQASFVNFGGNRHGFLPFAEIHPDYYRIPIADREALIAEQRAEMEEREAAEREAEEAEERQAAGLEEQPSVNAAESDEDEDDEDEDTVEEIGGEKPPIDEDEDEELDAVAAMPVETISEEPEDEELVIEMTAAEADDADDAEDAETEEEDSEEADESATTDESDEEESDAVEADASGEDEDLTTEDSAEGEGEEKAAAEGEAGVEGEGENRNRGRGRGRGNFRGGRSSGGSGRGGYRSGGRHSASASRRVEVLGGDGLDGDRPHRPVSRRHYKIQEVIKRGQIMLVQASKEERGNKGAAMTTYLSLPGRYCVLMPNSPRGGGVSRKIANFEERKRMREILSELNVPEGMSVIMRTAGMSRTKVEIKRDCDYLLRLWDEIRELTLKSSAPAMIHEEGHLIRRAVRDLYSRDIEEIHVSGEEGYKHARDFMKVMMPSHVKRVIEYTDEKMPLFQRYQVESQIRDMGEPNVTLKSGGYLVINPTEALVSVDVNSGRATRERHIEDTALKTNLEAAEEVARQLRLRDLGGLVVIDFIDMEDRRNNAKVERKLKESLSGDRARIQMGRISSFGLMEMSRQRLNPSLTEAQYEKCKYCDGVGHTRTVDNAAILSLRGLEEEAGRTQASQLQISLPDAVAIYILNHKRTMLADLERRYAIKVMIRADESLAPAGFKIEAMRSDVEADDDDSGEDSKPAERVQAERPESGRGDNYRGRNREGRDAPREGGRDRGNRSRFRRNDNETATPETQDAPAPMAAQQTGYPVEEVDAFDNIGNVAPPEPDEANDVDGNRDPAPRNDEDRGNRRRGRRGGRGREGGRDSGPRFEGNTPSGNAPAGEGQPPGDRPPRGPRRERGPRPEGDRPQRGPRRNAPDSAVATGAQPAIPGYEEQPVIGTASPRSNAVEPKFYGRRTPRAEQQNDSAANDAANVTPPQAAPKPYDVVSEPPGDQKKKGWWNRLVE